MQNNKILWREYYRKIIANRHRAQTEIAESLNTSGNYRAIDCGCGTGADILFLSEKGYEVFGFDNHEDSVRICRERFTDNRDIYISQNNFKDFSYPEAGVVVANSSLFFCEPNDFDEIWFKIDTAIPRGGVFCGDFMGFNDTWVSLPGKTVCPLTGQQVKGLFANYQIKSFQERDAQGITALGKRKHWHTYQVIARKNV